MTLPLIADYKTAVANAKIRFATLKVTPQLDAQRHPRFLAGNFAGVFKVCNADGAMLAVKCFTRDMPDLEKRYRALTKFSKTANASYLVDLEYLPTELYVTSSIAAAGDYAAVVMPWLEGTTIGVATETLCRRENRRALAALTRAWAKLCYNMLQRGIAHGDLKHDNIIITPDSKLKLIDYDSMYLPELKGLPSTLLGGINWQHPLRHGNHFDETIDHFSILVMLLSLRALTFEPGLLETYTNGENLILTRDDFQAPDSSALLKRLSVSADYYVRDWTRELIKSCKSSSIRISGLKDMVAAATKLDETAKDAGTKPLFKFFGLAAGR
ncbi:MAG: protein kinase family protein [Rhodospirillaceae bacterium]